MEKWSDSIAPEFSVKFFIDTNILVFLVDKTYPSLCDFIDCAKDSQFIELVSSKYVIFEFVGVRKKEHYLRKVASASKKSDKGEINFSSLLKYQNKFDDHLTITFDGVMSDIKKDVEDELLEISTDYKIDYNYSTLHDDQLNPTSEICLTTKIANQDSLVLISAVLPQVGRASHNVQVLTNDGDFARFFNHPNIDSIFSSLKIDKPSVVGISNIAGRGKTIYNLTQQNLRTDIENHLKEMILRVITEKNEDFYLGTTFPPSSASFPDDVICFKHNLNQPSFEEIYLTILSRDLKFIYTTKHIVSNLQHNKNLVKKGDTFAIEGKNYVSFQIFDLDGLGNKVAMDKNIVDFLRYEGNLVFVHPDSRV